MNGTILALVIAGVLVLAGIALIVVAVLLGRKAGQAEASTSSEAAARGTRGGRTFIDDPLETDIGSQLGKERPAPPEGAHPGGEEAQTGPAPGPALGRGRPRDDWDPETIPAPIRAGGSGPRKAGYDFRVQLAYRALMAGEFTRTITELQQAFALTDDPGARTELLIEIGHSSRMAGDYPAARAAYQDAITYSSDPLVWDNLHDWIEELADLEASAPPPDQRAVDTAETDEPQAEEPADEPDEIPHPVEDDEERGA